ncbi:putative transcriptional regulatory protein arsR family [Nitrosotalea sinensis]|uniref:Putative transcriptional regulatory protein arsR family n=1 Tax=Nitrosotalea sinensis TaxID=1499975 RepID=A0A2H1EIE7_9ARCH|nr:ArsR family transcriptional regulator [Candidatus Nitrosotalea sinensis]SHO47506.1 putative transcriptional regulatory protein arsR family [Candidatus Nitrosotalea sinensis]
MKNKIDSIFHILGNKTRRDILFALSDEPMYFNQVSKKIGIGQQAMLRHMQALVDTGFVRTYGEKSDFGAPDRKYYRLESSFNLSISLSEDEFTIDYNEEKIPSDKIEILSNKKFKQISDDPSNALGTLRKYLTEIDNDIQNLQSEINNLKAIRQMLLQKVHQIGQDNFIHLERKIIYKMMKENPTSVTELSHMISENKFEVLNALRGLHDKMDKGTMKTLVDELTT